MSPLWSVANQRRTSMLEENRQKEQKAAQILESEIRQHLDGLEEQVQRAKKEAHAKVQAGCPPLLSTFHWLCLEN